MAEAATLYCGPSGTGSGNGSDFNNRMQLPTTTGFTRGNTYVFIEGNYGSRAFSTAASSTTLITVKKASAADSGVTGYASSLHDGQAVFGDITFNTDYWIFDGVTGGGPGSWKTGHGIYIDRTGGSDETGIRVVDGVDNITCRHIEIEGHGADTDDFSQDGINCLTGSGPLTFSYMYIHDVGRCIIFNRSHNFTFEYSYTGEFESVAAQHAELASVWIDFAHTPVEGLVFRYNWLTYAGGPDSTGGLMLESDGAEIYGNVFAPIPADGWGNYGNGLLGIWSNSRFTNAKVYNNTFISGESANRVFGLFNSSGTQNTVDVRNNIFFNITVGNDSEGYGSNADIDHSYNLYASIADGPVTEATQTSITTSYDPFTDWENGDFTLKTNTAAGDDLGSPYDEDMFGNTRTTWTRGAIEFGSGGEGDETAPEVTAFVIPATYASLTVPISSFTATDAVGVTGYLVNESASTPSVDDEDWSGSAQTQYVFASAGSKTLYAWAKDAAGNISTSASDSVDVTLPRVANIGTLIVSP